MPSTTFTPTGSPQTFTVPAGVTTLTVDLVGAAGGITSPGQTGTLSIPATPQPITLGTREDGGYVASTGMVPGMVVHRVQARSNILDDGTGIVLDMYPASRVYQQDSITDAYGNTLAATGTALVCDGRVALSSVTAGTSATLNVANPAQLVGVDLKDVTINGDVTLGSQCVIRSNVKGVKRSPRPQGLMVGA